MFTFIYSYKHIYNNSINFEFLPVIFVIYFLFKFTSVQDTNTLPKGSNSELEKIVGKIIST